MSQQVLVERFFEALISGQRQSARTIVDECITAGVTGQAILEKLFWPTYERVQKMYRNDQLSRICHHFATRLLRMLTDQIQMRLDYTERNNARVLLLSGPAEGDELAGQMAADLLESAGYDVFFAGGGISNDEIVGQVGQLKPRAIALFGSAPSDLPYIRALIDEMRAMGLSHETQIVVGGGVFNRADGLAEEIGADLWAATPLELVNMMKQHPDRRMSRMQQTVGRSRRTVAA